MLKVGDFTFLLRNELVVHWGKRIKAKLITQAS